MQGAYTMQQQQQQQQHNNNTMESRVKAAPEQPAADPQSDASVSQSESTSPPDIVPDSHSVAAVSTQQPQQLQQQQQQQQHRTSWVPGDQQMAFQQMEEQKRLLKKQSRAIKFLKNEVASLKRKLHEIQAAQGINPDPQRDVMPTEQQQQDNNNNNNNKYPYTRRTSAGEHPPGKKMRMTSCGDDGSASHSASASFQSSVENSTAVGNENDPIPYEIQPSPTAARLYMTPQEEHDQTPNTFKVRNQTIVDPYGDRGMYSGSISSSSALPHGRGRMLYEDGQRIYKGGWNNGQWHGVGEAIFANGDRYNGDYHLDQRHGHGRYGWSDGRVYEGDFKADKRHGKGIFYWPDGAKYEGEFVNGFRDGHGTYLFSGGCKYTGEWKDGRYNGFGSCVWTSGRCYSGEWRNGMRHGKGVETEEDGSIRHDGQWRDDHPHMPNNNNSNNHNNNNNNEADQQPQQPQQPATPKRKNLNQNAGRPQGGKGAWFHKNNLEATTQPC